MSETIHGHSIDGDPVGLHYLERLEYGELETLINEAKNKGKSKFKYDDKHYEVVHTSGGTYVVTRVKADSGWF